MSEPFMQTVTLYHRVASGSGGLPTERWVRIVLKAVFFSATVGERTAKQGDRGDGGGVLFIPFAGHLDGYRSSASFDRDGVGGTIRDGDQFLEGELTYEIVRSSSELKALGNVSTVASIRRLPFGELAHWKVWCDGSRY
ncbi:MAG: hypothetical protein RR197_06335 [Oscillospiraceae bacterium]